MEQTCRHHEQISGVSALSQAFGKQVLGSKSTRYLLCFGILKRNNWLFFSFSLRQVPNGKFMFWISVGIVCVCVCVCVCVFSMFESFGQGEILVILR